VRGGQARAAPHAGGNSGGRVDHCGGATVPGGGGRVDHCGGATVPGGRGRAHGGSRRRATAEAGPANTAARPAPAARGAGQGLAASTVVARGQVGAGGEHDKQVLVLINTEFL
jgi:hypothetical protein